MRGSTNASRGIPWWACSVCAIDDEGPLAGIVENLANGTSYAAVRGKGATRNGEPIAPSTTTTFADDGLVNAAGASARGIGARWRRMADGNIATYGLWMGAVTVVIAFLFLWSSS